MSLPSCAVLWNICFPNLKLKLKVQASGHKMLKGDVDLDFQSGLGEKHPNSRQGNEDSVIYSTVQFTFVSGFQGFKADFSILWYHFTFHKNRNVKWTAVIQWFYIFFLPVKTLQGAFIHSHTQIHMWCFVSNTEIWYLALRQVKL